MTNRQVLGGIVPLVARVVIQSGFLRGAAGLGGRLKRLGTLR